MNFHYEYTYTFEFLVLLLPDGYEFVLAEILLDVIYKNVG